MSPRRAGWALLLLCAAAAASVAAGAPAVWPAVCAALWLLAAAARGGLRRHPALGAWLAWTGWSAACLLRSTEPWLALWPWWRGATAVLLFVLACSWWWTAHRRFWAVGIGVAAGVILAAKGLGHGPGGGVGEAFACAAAAAAAAGFLGLGDDEDWAWRWGAAAAALGLAAALTWMGSWTALAAAGAGLALHLAGSRPVRWRLPLALACAAAAVAAAGLAWRTGALGWAHWEPALRLAFEHPLTGVGPGLIGRWLPEGAPVAPLPARLLAETGFIGLGLFAWAVWTSRPKELGRAGWEGRSAAAALGALAAKAVLDADLGAPVLEAFFMTALAGAAGARWPDPEAGRESLREGVGTLEVPRAALVAGLAACAAAWAPREVVTRAWAQTGSPEAARRIAGLERVLSVAPRESRASVSLARERLLSKPARLGAALDEVSDAVRADRKNPLYRGLQADLFMAVGDFSRAAAEGELALALEPKFLAARLLVAECRLLSGDLDAARAELERARALRPAGGSAVPAEGGLLGAWDARREARIERALGSHDR